MIFMEIRFDRISFELPTVYHLSIYHVHPSFKHFLGKMNIGRIIFRRAPDLPDCFEGKLRPAVFVHDSLVVHGPRPGKEPLIGYTDIAELPYEYADAA